MAVIALIKDARDYIYCNVICTGWAKMSICIVTWPMWTLNQDCRNCSGWEWNVPLAQETKASCCLNYCPYYYSSLNCWHLCVKPIFSKFCMPGAQNVLFLFFVSLFLRYVIMPLHPGHTRPFHPRNIQRETFISHLTDRIAARIFVRICLDP